MSTISETLTTISILALAIIQGMMDNLWKYHQYQFQHSCLIMLLVVGNKCCQVWKEEKEGFKGNN